MKKFFTSILALCAAAVLFPAGARERSVSEAQKVADSFKSGALTRSATPSKLAYTAVSPSHGAPCFYVFNREEGGFVLVSADTELPDVIGYSTEGSFDYDKLPPAMKWWLSGYEKEIAAVYDGVAVPMKKIKTRSADYVDIEPLVQTKWDQGAPYNDLCPLEGTNHAWTGCVATSTSQILNYHKYFKGSGSHTDIKNTTMSVDYSTLTIDWDLMRNTYSSQDKGPNAGTAEQRAEVAKLMKAVGVAVDMSYSTDGSGAYHQMVASALQKYFGIAKTATFVSRNWYSDDEWVELIYNELKANRPMVYGGASANTAHSFVCDGYQADGGYWHMNWGWGGSYDGWFALSCLAPEGIGAGGGDGDYTLDQQAVIGIQAPAEGQVQAVIVEGYGETADATLDYTGTNGSFEVFSIDLADSQWGVQARGNIFQVWQEPRDFDFQGQIYTYPDGEKAGVAEFYYYEWGDVNDWVSTKKTMPATFYWKNANDLVWWEYAIWELNYVFPTLPKGLYTLSTQYKLSDTDMNWQTVYWDNNIDGTIYFTVDADGNRTFVTRDELAELDDTVLVESIEIKPKGDSGSEEEEVEIAVGATMNMWDLCEVTITPPDATQKLIWQSWGTDILEVSPDGVAVAKKDGMVRVTLSTANADLTRAEGVMAEIMVKVGTGTGVEAIENGAEAVSVEARDGVITLSNVPADSQVNVYSVAGVHVASVAGTGTVEVNVGNSGIYVVTVGDKRFKVRL